MTLNDYQHLESIAAKNGAILVNAAALLAWREEMRALRAAVEKFEDKIEDIINEFGDDPAQALLCIGERIELRRITRVFSSTQEIVVDNMRQCFMCRKEAETQHFELYVIGSEGIDLCLRCRIEVCGFINQRASEQLQLRKAEQFLARRRPASP